MPTATKRPKPGITLGQFRVFKYSIPQAGWYCWPQESARFTFKIVPDSADSALVGASIKMDVKGPGSLVIFFPDVGDVVYPDPMHVPNPVAEAWWGQIDDWLHVENHNLERAPDPYDTQSLVAWNIMSNNSLHLAGLTSYPVVLEFNCGECGDGCSGLEIRNFEMSVYYLDNAAQK